MGGGCQYTPEQLVDGKYVRYTVHGGILTGVVDKVQGDMALVAGCWRRVDAYEVMPPSQECAT